MAAATPAPAAPLALARVSLTRRSGLPAISLQLGAPELNGEVEVSVGSGDSSRVLWKGSAEEAAPFVVVPSEMGTGPVSVPITVRSQSGTQHYTLFAPTTARLGEVAERSPRIHYDGQPLSKVLSDLSALTGLVVLAEGPLDRKVMGDLPVGSPEFVLAQLAAQAGLQAQRQEKAVYLLTPQR